MGMQQLVLAHWSGAMPRVCVCSLSPKYGSPRCSKRERGRSGVNTRPIDTPVQHPGCVHVQSGLCHKAASGFVGLSACRVAGRATTDHQLIPPLAQFPKIVNHHHHQDPQPGNGRATRAGDIPARSPRQALLWPGQRRGKVKEVRINAVAPGNGRLAFRSRSYALLKTATLTDVPTSIHGKPLSTDRIASGAPRTAPIGW